MTKEFKSVEKLEIGKDYINVHNNDIVVIDRVSDIQNKGFVHLIYENYLRCSNHSDWREATEEEVIEAFKRHLIHYYGEDWQTMKIKERHPDLSSAIGINNGLWNVKISKEYDGWNVWNNNGLLYRNGIWVERLEEEEKNKIMKKYKLKQWYPSLGINWRTNDSYEYDAYRQVMTNISNVKNGFAMPKEMAIKEQELHPDFWELIEEEEHPLFITEDGVEVFDGDKYILIGDHYSKIHMVAYNCNAPYSRGVKKFKHEPNADEYIWKNKTVFSYNDVMELINLRLYTKETIEHDAKERSKE